MNQTQSLIYQGDIRYESPLHEPGNLLCKADWMLYRPAPGQYLSLVIERDDNPGMSVTNAAEQVIAAAKKLIIVTKPADHPVAHVRFFEAYPYYLQGAEPHVDEVIQQGGKVITWARMSYADFIKLTQLAQ